MKSGDTVLGWGGVVVEYMTKPCKHALKTCAKCGTNAERDMAHATKNGRGRIAVLSKKKGTR